uniref:Uncharacterized protein n=1 Tax=Oscillatoriales cyanobacterium SpSt-418 TaxID=2282169 RepID=A0A7C3KGZ7_9CYAN
MKVYKIITGVSYPISKTYPDDWAFHKRGLIDNYGSIHHDAEASYFGGPNGTRIFLGTEEAFAELKNSRTNYYKVDDYSSMWGEIDYFTMRRDAMGIFHARAERCPMVNLILGPPDVITHDVICRADEFFGFIQSSPYTSPQRRKQVISELAIYIGYFGLNPI